MDHVLRRVRSNEQRLEALLQDATTKDATYSDFLEAVLSEEVSSKAEKNVTMRTHLARFPFVKTLESFDWSYQPSLDKKQLQTLATCRFVEAGENVILLGPPAWARLTWPSASASRRSSTATGCSSRPRPP